MAVTAAVLNDTGHTTTCSCISYHHTTTSTYSTPGIRRHPGSHLALVQDCYIPTQRYYPSTLDAHDRKKKKSSVVGGGVLVTYDIPKGISRLFHAEDN